MDIVASILITAVVTTIFWIIIANNAYANGYRDGVEDGKKIDDSLRS